MLLHGLRKVYPARGGDAVKVSDVAQVHRSQQTPPQSMAVTDGQAGIIVGDEGVGGLGGRNETTSSSSEWNQNVLASIWWWKVHGEW